MKIFSLILFSLLCSILCAQQDENFIAYSLSSSERLLSTGGRNSAGLFNLGGITAIAGMIYDEKSNDIIIVGRQNNGQPQITLDDLVVALRSMMVYKDPPLVSIDRTPETAKTGKQKVVFRGHIENTKFGYDLLQADITLKKLALDLTASDIWGSKSYFTNVKERYLNNDSENVIGSRFWFKIQGRPAFAAPKDAGVFTIRELKLEVNTEILYAKIDGKEVEDLSVTQDEEGNLFAQQITSNFSELSLAYPEIGRVKTLLDLVSLSRGLEYFPSDIDLDFWLKEFPVKRFETDSEYDLLTNKVEEKDFKNRMKHIELNGGIELQLLAIDLHAGDVSALKKIVLQSRPSQKSLSWKVPLSCWRIPDALPVIGEEPCSDELALADLDGIDLDDEGFFLETLIYYNEKPVGITNETFPTIANNFPEFGIFEGVPSQQIVDDIGGVLLTGMAQINNSNGDFSFITGGNFSLVGNVEGSQIDPTLFARFVTTLWSVYYDSLSPGISIDPIAPNIKKHMVRYIGNVINTDLGRVMREADYTMKKWWIGTERPYIPGFRNSDELNADRGTIYVGVSKRNWFVPENMIFRQVGNMLLFKSGRMTLKTEFVNRDTRISADPADVKFAQFFTEHYDEIAKKHPIYQELLDYAKLVGLANYLKINRIPLLWFLMANKDLLLTEDSPGTVDELIRGSKYFKGIEISGGVEMTFQPGQYIYDQSAITAINQAINKHRPSHKTVSQMMLGKEVAISQSSNQNFSFQFENKEYSVIHQHSTSSGVDRRGIRYQTDIALKNGIEPGLELVRYYDPNQSERFGSFGKGWHLLKPYSIELVDKDTVHFGHYIIKKRIAVVNNLSGTRETLTFNDDRFVAAAYVPNSIEESQVLALLPMTDNSLILRDKIGNEFHFDRTWNMVNMFLGPHFQMGFEYTEGLLTQFEEKPYELEIVGNKYTDFLNIKVPTHLKLKNFLTGESELLTFKKRWGIAAYVPDEEKSIVRKMVLMTDGSFRLVDWENNEVVFFPDGTFNGLFPNQDAQRVVSAITQGIYRVEFGISLDERNRVRISNATLFKQGQSTPLLRMKYFYDEKGRLARIRRSDEVIAQN